MRRSFVSIFLLPVRESSGGGGSPNALRSVLSARMISGHVVRSVWFILAILPLPCGAVEKSGSTSRRDFSGEGAARDPLPKRLRFAPTLRPLHKGAVGSTPSPSRCKVARGND